jgi:hypothetical protein
MSVGCRGIAEVAAWDAGDPTEASGNFSFLPRKIALIYRRAVLVRLSLFDFPLQPYLISVQTVPATFNFGIQSYAHFQRMHFFPMLHRVVFCSRNCYRETRC